jgi:MarR family transcriptional regulator for hemolysin
MEVDGLLTRHRDATNRRIQIVELTDVGEGAFVRLRDAAIEFDARLRRGLAAADLQQVQQTLARLTENAGAGELGSTPWSGLVGDER